MKKEFARNNVVLFSFGEIGLQFGWTFLGTYLSVFYTDVVGLTPLAVSIIMLVARIWDAVNDPMMGVIAERTRTKWGRFRPYIGFAAPILAAFIILCFTNPFGGGASSARITYAAITYIIAGMVYTAVCVPYAAMPGVMTKSANERTKLNAGRSFGQNAGMIIINACSAGLLLFFSGTTDVPNGRGYLMTAVIYVVIMVVMLLACFFSSKEQIIPTREEVRVPVKTTVKTVLSNKYLLVVVLMMALYMTAFMGRISVMAFYCIYCLNDFKLIALLMTIPSIGGLAVSFIVPALSRWLGKRNVFMFSVFVQAASLLVVFLTPFQNIGAIIAAHVVFGIFNMGFAPSLSMMSDAVDYQDLRTGVRTDGTAFATYNLAVKLGNAVGGGLFVLVMGAFGYVANQAQSKAALGGINLVVNLIPAILFLLAGISSLLWRISDKQADEVRAQIEARNQKAASAQQ